MIKSDWPEVNFWKSKEVVFWEVTGSVVASKRATITETERKENGNFEDMMILIILCSFDSIGELWMSMHVDDTYLYTLFAYYFLLFHLENTEVVV